MDEFGDGMAMRKWLLTGALLTVLAAGGHFGWQWWTEGRFTESTDNAYVESDMTVIAPKVQGYVASVAVKDNQAVKAGDVLLAIDDADYRNRVAQAAARLATAQAAVASIDSKLALSGSTIAEARAGLASTEAELARAQQDLDRYRQLSARQFASTQRFDTAQADQRKAAAARDRAAASLAEAKGQVDVLKAGRHEAEAQAGEARAALAAAELDLANTVLRAPAAGIVGNRTVQPGQYVKAGSQLMVLVPDASTYVVANFKETQLAEMRPGQPVRIAVDAFDGREIAGRIDSFAPASGAKFSLLPPENATGNFTKIVQRVPVRIRLEAADPLVRQLVPGLSVEVAVDTRAEGSRTADAAFGFGAAQAAAR